MIDHSLLGRSATAASQVQHAVRDEVIQKRMSSVLENLEIEALRCKSPPPSNAPSVSPPKAPGVARSHTSG